MKVRPFIDDPVAAAVAAPGRGPALPANANWGMPLGINSDTGDWLKFHPWYLRQMRILSSMVFMILGIKGFGKSALAKVLAGRFGVLSMAGGQPPITWIYDHKIEGEEGEGEFAPISRFYRAKTLKVAQQQTNPFYMGASEELLDPTDILIITIAMYESYLKRKLTSDEAFIVQMVVFQMTKKENALRGIASPGYVEKTMRTFTPDLVDDFYEAYDNQLLESFKRNLLDPDLHQVRPGASTTDPSLRNLEAELQMFMKRPSSFDMGELTDIAQSMSRTMVQILLGPAKGVIGDNHTMKRDFEGQRVIVSDMSGMTEYATDIIRTLDNLTQTRAISRRYAPMIPHIAFYDEIQEILGNRAFRESLESLIAKSRSTPTARFLNSQHFGGFLQGAVGSAEYESGKRMIKNTGGFFFTRMDPAEDTMAMVQQVTGMSKHDARRTTQHNVGQYTLVMPGPHRTPAIHFEIVVTPQELEWLPTDSATAAQLEFIPVLEQDGVIRRINRISGKKERFVPGNTQWIGG